MRVGRIAGERRELFVPDDDVQFADRGVHRLGAEHPQLERRHNPSERTGHVQRLRAKTHLMPSAGGQTFTLPHRFGIMRLMTRGRINLPQI